MDEITLDDKKYLSSRQAAKVTGYAKDYVGQLCREGRVDARLVGRNWYVLETSILEHRFGAEEPKETPTSIPTTPVSTWEAPIYTNEAIRTVPELAPKPPVPVTPIVPPPAQEDRKVLSDMQSAWQEWFQQQNKAEKALPDASEMLLEEGDDTEPVTEMGVPEEKVVEEEQAIHVERVHETVKAEPLREYDEISIPVVRKRTPVSTESYSGSYTAQVRERAPVRTKRVRTSGRGSQAIASALLISLTGLAVLLTVLASGSLDQVMESSHTQSAITNFFAGIQEVSK